MLNFAVFDQHGLASDWPLRQAYLFGPGEIPVQAEIRFEGGIIRCEKPSPEAAGLAVQFEVDPVPGAGASAGGGGLGLLVLRTTLLPRRAEPYLLSLELARHRIMLLLNKLEDWGLFDLPTEHRVMRQLEQARAEFTGALVSLTHEGSDSVDSKADPAAMLKADAAAKRALALALDASEQLALIDADRTLKFRLDGSLYARSSVKAADSFSADRTTAEGAVKSAEGIGVVLPNPPQVGCSVNPEMFSEPLTRAVGSTFDFINLPMRWSDMEPSEGKYAFGKTDKWIEWAVRTAKIPVYAGPLIDFRELSVPEWLYIWEHDYETLRELVYEHVKTLVTRYRRTVTRWTVCSGLHVNESFAMSLERMMDLTRICALMVKKLQPTAKVQVEIAQPWGEYFARNKRSLPPTMYAEMLTQAGIAIDALGLRVQMGEPAPGRLTRDTAAFSDMLDRYAELERPLAITAIGAPSAPVLPSSRGRKKDREAAPTEAGRWRGPWSPEVQGRWATQAISIAMAKPYVHSVCWQDLYDSNAADMPSGGLVSDSGAAKPALTALGEVRKLLKRPPAK
jgi:hypothetical protein